MTKRFASAYQRIRWAENDLVELKRNVFAFFAKQGGDYGRSRETDPQTGETIDKIRLTGPLPMSITKLTVQIVESLRSALDHAACAVVPRIRQKKTYFPFGLTKREFEDALRTRCKYVPEEIKAIFRRLRPYKEGNPLLWSLNNLCNAGKHRTLIVPSIHVKDVAFDDVSLGWFGLLLTEPKWNRRKNEIILARVRGEGTSHHDVEFSLGIQFGKIAILNEKPVLSVLRFLSRKIEGIVMMTEAEARRLGIV